MELLLLMLFLVLFVPVAFMVALATWGALGVSSLRRANKVVPSRSAISAPLRWLWSPSPAAVLHRRLRSACALAGSVEGSLPRERWPRRRREPVNDGIVSLAQEVLQEAVALDHQLQSTSLLPRGVPRDQALSRLGLPGKGARGRGPPCPSARDQTGPACPPRRAGHPQPRREDQCDGGGPWRAHPAPSGRLTRAP